MDVTCERCSTEYEFDDALVSERGTTVKCTNCGHQFKVRRTDGRSAPERWLVRTVDGRELEFTALRELQGAIAHGRVTKDDVLSRGGSRPRRLGSIAELEPFFANASGASTAPGLGVGPARARIPTPTGLGDPGGGTAAYRNEGSVAIPLPIAPPRDAVAAAPERWPGDEPGSGRPPLAPRRPAALAPAGSVAVSPIAVPTPRIGMGATLPGVVVPPGEAPPLPGPDAPPRVPTDPMGDFAATSPSPMYAGAAADLAPPPRSVPDDAPTLPRGMRVSSEMEARGSDGDYGRGAYPPATPRAERASDPPPAAGRRPVDEGNGYERTHASSDGGSAPPPLTPTPTDVRASYYENAPYTEPRFSSMTPSKQAGRIRWIAGLVVLGTMVFVGLTIGRKYLSAGQAPQPSASAPAAGSEDERIARHLAGADASLLEGNLETAKEHVDKATALGDSDPRVATQAARLAMIRAEVAWLRVRLLAEDDPQLAASRKDLEVAAERARKAADRAAELAPKDPAVTRYRIDALRLSGDREGARKLVPGLGAAGAQPDNALVLAALDLAEDKPDWRTVLERLRTAASGEQKLGRARALLVYALARSGAAADAKTELDRLANLPRPHPLVQPLRALLERADKDGKVVDVGSLPDAAGKRDPAPRASGDATARPKGDAPKAPGRADGRVPDDYVWPGYNDDKPAPPKPAEPAQPAPTTSDPPGGKQ